MSYMDMFNARKKYESVPHESHFFIPNDRMIAQLIPNGSKVLDYGCGNDLNDISATYHVLNVCKK